MSSMSKGAGGPTASSLWLAASRPVAVLLLTAFAVATANSLDERFFHPDTFATGPWLGRWAFVFVVSVPFILSGLLFLGLPASYALRRFSAETSLNYALAGLVTGAIWGLIVTDRDATDVVLTGLLGAVCLLFWWLLRPKR